MNAMPRARYRALIEEDLRYLRRQPKSLARNHIEDVLLRSIDLEYPPTPRERQPSVAPVDLPAPEGACALHPRRALQADGLCVACRQHLVQAARAYWRHGTLPGPTTHAAEALRRLDLRAARLAGWPWADFVAEMRQELGVADAA